MRAEKKEDVRKSRKANATILGSTTSISETNVMEKFTDDIVRYAYHGIDEHIEPDETVVVNLRDLMKVKATLAELVQFFHQPMHYSTIEDVHKYMGNTDSNGAFALLGDANYDIMRRMLPKKIDDLFDTDAFDAPEKPYYFKSHD